MKLSTDKGLEGKRLRGKIGQLIFFKNMQKIFYILMIAAVGIIILGGIFLWSEVSEDADIIPAVKMEPPENYEILETDEGVFVENSNVGLKFKVPDGWEVEKAEIQTDGWIINITSPDISFGEEGLLSEGCGFSVWVEQREDMANAVRFRINNPEEYSNEINGSYEAIFVAEKSALKMTLPREGWGAMVEVQIPIEDRVIAFDTLFRPETEQRCSGIFNQFLEQVEVK